MKFQKISLLTLSLICVFSIQGYQYNMHAETQPQQKTMKEELLEFAHSSPTEHKIRDGNEIVTNIVKHYLHVGMPIEEAKHICEKNGIQLTQPFRTQAEIKRGIYAYAGTIDNIFVTYNPLIFLRISFDLEYKSDKKIVNIKGYKIAESRI